jgi:hypothetical protein
VIDVGVSTPAVVHGFWGGLNPTTFQVSNLINGPILVIYHPEIYSSDGTLPK